MRWWRMEKGQDKQGLKMQCVSSQVSFFLLFLIHSLTYVIYRLKMTTAATVNTTTSIPITHSNIGYNPPSTGVFFYITFNGGWRCITSPAPGMETAGPKGTGITGDMRHDVFHVPFILFYFLNIFYIIFMPESQGTRDMTCFMSLLCFFLSYIIFMPD